MSHIGGIIDYTKVCLPTIKTKACDPIATLVAGSFAEGTAKDLQRIRITNNVTLPAGALSVEILPKEYGQKVTINGEDHWEGDRFHRQMKVDESSGKVYYVKEIQIVADGTYNLAVSYPEESTVDFSVLGL